MSFSESYDIPASWTDPNNLHMTTSEPTSAPMMTEVTNEVTSTNNNLEVKMLVSSSPPSSSSATTHITTNNEDELLDDLPPMQI